MKMFEDKEEVKKAMMDLKLFGLDGFESPDDDILESSIEMAENQIQVRISLQEFKIDNKHNKHINFQFFRYFPSTMKSPRDSAKL